MKIMKKIVNAVAARRIAKMIKKETGRKAKVKVHTLDISKSKKQTTIHADVVFVFDNNDLDDLDKK